MSHVKTPSKKIKGVKLKKKKNATNINLDEPIIKISEKGDYLKLIAIIGKDQEKWLCTNNDFEYLLDMSLILSYIASSILQGTLNMMVFQDLIREDEDEIFQLDEKSNFLEDDDFIFMIYGRYNDKMGDWILKKLKLI